MCFGWIDGVRHSIDDERYQIRFTPRKPHGKWSLVNIERAKELTRLGRMQRAGSRAFEKRDETAALYLYEQRDAPVLDEDAERVFRADARAWEFFQRQIPSYRRLAIFWVVRAKKEETRRRRLATLIEDSAHGRTIKGWLRPAKRG